MADVAAATLDRLSVFERNNQIRYLSMQLDLLSKRGREHNSFEWRRLRAVAGALRLLDDGTIARAVRDIAATLPPPRGDLA